MTPPPASGAGRGLNEVALWLLHEGWRQQDYRQLFDGIAARLLAQGVPLQRMAAYIPALDPEVFGDGFIWKRAEGGAQHIPAPYSLLAEDGFRLSPLHEMRRTGLPFRRRLAGPQAVLDYPLLLEFRDAGASDYFGLYVPFADGTPVYLTFVGDGDSGFSDADIRIIEDVALVLARLTENFAVRLRVERLLNTYVGRDAGRRVIAGQVQRGGGETIEAAVLFSDLRDFTRLSEALSRDDTLQLLNDYFDMVGKAVTGENGEILKFVGDGVLAIFPVDAGRAMPQAALAAIQASQAIFTGLQAWNAQRQAAGRAPVGFGIAVHGGEVMYGNVGASGRLDFTAIGPVVNTVSRLQSLCRELERPILLSRQIRDFWPDYCEPVARRRLRGIAREAEIFALRPQAVRSPAALAK